MTRFDVTLRQVEDSDLETFFEHQQDPVAYEMAAVAPKERAAFYEHWRRNRANPSGVMRTVLVDGQVAGNMLSWEQDGLREIGYWIGREHWGNGVATAACRAFVDVLPYRPLYAHVAVHNAGSMRVLEKCGFRRTTTPDGQHTLVAPDGIELAVYVLER